MFGVSKAKKYVDRNSWKTPRIYTKNITMFIMGRIGTLAELDVIEYSGEAIENLSMEGRMTLCNMAIEAGARAGMVAPDEKPLIMFQINLLHLREELEHTINYWKTLKTGPSG